MQYLSTYFVAMLVYASFGLVNLVASSRRFEQPDLWEHVIMVAFGLLIALPLHEAGHLLAGTAQGFVCVRFGFGPVEVSRVDQGWRVRMIPVRRLWSMYQVPSSFTRFRLQQAITLAAGPSLSLVFCLIFTTIGLRQDNPTRFWFWMVNAQMCLLVVLELIPVEFRQIQSDGMYLWRLYRGGIPLDILERDLLADSVNYSGLRPRDWPADLMDRIADLPVDEAQLQYCRYLAYIHYRDAEQIDTAWIHLKGVLDSWEPGDAAHYALEGAYFLASHRRELAAACEWLDQENRFAGRPIRLRAEAAVASAEDRRQDALSLIEEAERQLRATRTSGNREFELDTLRAMREEIGLAAPGSLESLVSAVEKEFPGPLTAGHSPAL